MIGQGSRATRGDFQVAMVRWVVYLAAAVGFLLAWIVDTQRIAFPFSSGSAMVLVMLAVLGNGAITAMAYYGWMGEYLSVGSVAFDGVLALLAYVLHGSAADATAISADPLYILALLPAITTALRFDWQTGVGVAMGVGLVRALILLLGMPEPFASANLLPALFGMLGLVGAAFLSGYLGQSLLQRGAPAQAGTAPASVAVQVSQPASTGSGSLQELTDALGTTLDYERVIELALDVSEQAMAEWGARGQLVAQVFLFDNGSKMKLVAGRHLPRYDLETQIRGEAGIVARCVAEAEPIVTQSPRDDPELYDYSGVAECQVAAAIPLQTGFDRYGAMVFATRAFSSFSPDQLGFFSAVAGRATIALHNALLYENLQAERDRIVAVEEEARRKLSRDLHDGPTQAVSAIAMRLDFASKKIHENPQLVKEELEKTRDLALETVREIRHMLFTLRPLVLETQGLVPALQSLAEKIQAGDKLKVYINESNNASSRLDTNQSGVIFLLIEEALGNIHKHAQANRVDIRMWIDGDLFAAQVQDDGVGFDTVEVLSGYESRGSLGMVNMRERAALIGGSFDIKSFPGQGTTITWVVPLDRDDAA